MKKLVRESLFEDMSQNFIEYFEDMSQEKKDKALINASRRGHTEAVKSLINAGADVHANNKEALQWASANGHIEVVKLLLDAGADVHAKNDLALRWANEEGHTKVVKLLKQSMNK